MIGPLLNIGFEGRSLPRSVQILIRRHRLGGVTLFSRNYESKRQLAGLARRIQRLSPDLPLFVCVDQEGGRVQRLREGFTAIPSAREMGRWSAWRVFELFRKVGRELAAVGINTNFAPVLDVDTCPENPVIGDRSFGSDPRLVGRLGRAVIRGLRDAGVIACGKHFPGHGQTSTDSHHALPRVDTTPTLLARRELVPYRGAIRSGLGLMMTAHVVYQRMDARRPATLSKSVLLRLKKRLHFNGLVLSDDLDMEAIRGRWSYDEAFVLGLEAGVDIFLICRPKENSIERLIEEVGRRADHDVRLRILIESAVRRVDRFREKGVGSLFFTS